MLAKFILFLPLVSCFWMFFTNCFVKNEFKGYFASEYFCSSIIALSAFLSWILFFTYSEDSIVHISDWFSVGMFSSYWSIKIDRVTLLMFVVVNSIASFIHFYSIGYMAQDSRRGLFFIYLGLFVFFMLLLVSASDLIQLFCGWEGVGFASYLLIGFWYEKQSACIASVKAFIVNRIGDLFLLIGIIMIFCIFNTVNFDEIFGLIKGNEKMIYDHYQMIALSCFFVFIGCMGKSAQIGLHVWLPDAMEGPTPVSGLIHSATMVTAGVFLSIRMAPIFEMVPQIRLFILIIGTITAVFASTIAIAQDDIKKVIAYSTCSQLGYMFVAIGLSAYNAALFHLFTHAFFKSLLFMCAGNVIVSLHHEQNVRKMGKLSKVLKITYVVHIIGSLSLIGIFPFAGYYSKDLIIEYAFVYPVVFSAVIFAAFLTALYSWRLIILIYHENPINDACDKAHKVPKVMLYSVVLLSFFAIFAGIIGKNLFKIELQEFWFNIVPVVHPPHLNLMWMILPMLVGLLGIITICFLRKFLLTQNNFFTKILRNKYYFDEIYKYCFVYSYNFISIFSRQLDIKLIDNFLLVIRKFINHLAQFIVTTFNVGFLHRYLLYMISAMVFSMFFVYCFLSFV